MKKIFAGLFSLFALASLAFAAPDGNIRSSEAICNPNAPTQCLLPDINGSIAVTPGTNANAWSYAAAASGISNTTTAVTIKTAAGAGIRNYISSCQLSSDALGAASEFAIRDGAAGTVLWRAKLTTTGIPSGLSISFDPPLRGTANTLLEVVTLTASITGALYVDCQGLTGS